MLTDGPGWPVSPGAKGVPLSVVGLRKRKRSHPRILPGALRKPPLRPASPTGSISPRRSLGAVRALERGYRDFRPAAVFPRAMAACLDGDGRGRTDPTAQVAGALECQGCTLSRLRRWVVGAAGPLVAVAVAVGPAEAGLASPLVESFSRPASTWVEQGAVRGERVFVGSERVLRVSGRGTIERRLPARHWALSMDLAAASGARLTIGLGDRRHRLRLSRARRGGPLVLRLRGGRARLSAEVNPRKGSWIHLQAIWTRRGVRGSVGGRAFALRPRAGRRLLITVGSGSADLDNIIVTPASASDSLLVHRLADLQHRIPRRGFLVGADGLDRLYLNGRFWTRGFFAGALWHAAALTPRSDLFREWAIARTQANFGQEWRDSHDVGMVYEQSSYAAQRRVCGARARRLRYLCERARQSSLGAAANLLSLAASNPGGGTIPTRVSTPDADTIIDSMMNLSLLWRASQVTGNPAFRRVGAQHARRTAELLVRPDGSTAQSAHTDRDTGTVLLTHSHQGLSANSTWSRGQGWAVYGFADAAYALRDPKLLAIAERTAGYVERRLPPSGVPQYDYDAPPGAPVDTSAGVITAAALFRLDEVCRRWTGTCAQPRRWSPLARRMLKASLRYVSPRLPLGFFGGQVGTYGGPYAWDDSAELVYGLSFALDAIRRSRRAPE